MQEMVFFAGLAGATSVDFGSEGVLVGDVALVDCDNLILIVFSLKVKPAALRRSQPPRSEMIVEAMFSVPAAPVTDTTADRGASLNP